LRWRSHSSSREGVKRLAVLTLGFAADCLETLEEIGVGRRREIRGAPLPQRQRDIRFAVIHRQGA
jgi:protoheme ferro-lyase